MAKLTKARIGALKYDGDGQSRCVRWDDAMPGFGVRVYPTGKKAFVLSYRSGGRKQLMVLGRCEEFETVEDARSVARRNIEIVRKGESPLEAKRKASQGKTLGDLIDRYIEDAKGHKKTWRKDEYRLNRHVPQSWRKRDARSITALGIDGLLRPIGARTPYEHNRLLEILRRMFKLGKRLAWGHLEPLDPNPAAEIDKLPEKKRRRYIREVDELPFLAKAIDGEQSVYIRAVFWVYLLTGLRKRELLDAKRSDIDWTAGKLRLPDTKSGEPQEATLSGAALAILQSLPRMEGNPYLFPSPQSTKNDPKPLNNIDKAWKRILESARVQAWAVYQDNPQVPALVERLKEKLDRLPTADEVRVAAAFDLPPAFVDLRIHDLRRSVGSWLTQDGTDLNVIKEGLRHANISTTLTYARLGRDAAREAFEAHGKRILAAAGKSAPVDVTGASA